MPLDHGFPTDDAALDANALQIQANAMEVHCIFTGERSDECGPCTGTYCTICRGPCTEHDWAERHDGLWVSVSLS